MVIFPVVADMLEGAAADITYLYVPITMVSYNSRTALSIASRKSVWLDSNLLMLMEATVKW